jgi:hypothetical protein
MSVMAGAVRKHMLSPAPWIGNKQVATLISIAIMLLVHKHFKTVAQTPLTMGAAAMAVMAGAVENKPHALARTMNGE